MAIAAAAPDARARRDPAPDAGPAPLLPQPVARLLGLAALGSLGALEWQRLVAGLSSGRALLWVLAAVGTGALLVASGRARARWPRAAALAAVAVAGVMAGYAASGLELRLLEPEHWGELTEGLAGGAASLGTVRLPYASVDPWPGRALQLLGAELLVLAALLACWPRAGVVGAGERPLRGYPFLALAVLLILVASPVVSLGGTRPLALGVGLASLTVCFLWLERLPLRPGVGVAALLAVALAGALPLAAVADRGEPWFDYESFAEGLGPDDATRFSWRQQYGPIDWPRDGNEIMRIEAEEPMYWKARDLDVFDGRSWAVRRDTTPLGRPGDAAWEADLPEDWRNRPAWTSTIRVSVRRTRMRAVVGAGTIMSVSRASREVRPGLASGTWDAVGDLRRGDSYSARVHAPQPGGSELTLAESGERDQQASALMVTVPFKRGRRGPGLPPGEPGRRVRAAELQFRPFGDFRSAFAAYPTVNRSWSDVDEVMRRTSYARTWRIAKRLRRGARSPFAYIVRVDRFLRGSDFRYSERPEQPPRGREPLDFFIATSHEGYCQHFAGAMALLLRMGGVPARVATGFSPGGYSKRRAAWVVRDTDAHAWVEAWFDRFGWVTFDPTPDATPARSQIAALEAPPAPATPAEGAESAGAAGGGAAANRQRPGELRGDLRFDRLRDAAVGGGAGTSEDAASPWWPWALVAVLLLSALAAGALLAAGRGARGATPYDRAIAELEAALRRSGRPAPPGTTLRQLERRLGGSPEVVAYLRALSAGRYAGASAPPPAQGRRELRRALAQGLGPAGRLRALWALPPRLR